MSLENTERAITAQCHGRQRSQILELVGNRSGKSKCQLANLCFSSKGHKGSPCSQSSSLSAATNTHFVTYLFTEHFAVLQHTQLELLRMRSNRYFSQTFLKGNEKESARGMVGKGRKFTHRKLPCAQVICLNSLLGFLLTHFLHAPKPAEPRGISHQSSLMVITYDETWCIQPTALATSGLLHLFFNHHVHAFLKRLVKN